MGGHLAEAAAVVVGFLPGDVLGEDDHKIRVRRCYVAPGVTSFPQIIRNGWAAGANLAGADLARANLAGANLAGAYLADATADRWTRWPAGFDPEGAGVNVR